MRKIPLEPRTRVKTSSSSGCAGAPMSELETRPMLLSGTRDLPPSPPPLLPRPAVLLPPPPRKLDKASWMVPNGRHDDDDDEGCCFGTPELCHAPGDTAAPDCSKERGSITSGARAGPSNKPLD